MAGKKPHVRKGITMPSTHTDASEVSILNRLLRPECANVFP